MTDIISVGVFLLFLAGVIALLYSYKKNGIVKTIVDNVLIYIPVLSRFAASKVSDTKGVFDAHDALMVISRISEGVAGMISDPLNARFEDYEEDIYTLFKTELSRYVEAGVLNVPDLTDESVKAQVRLIFDQIVKVLGNEQNSAGADKQD